MTSSACSVLVWLLSCIAITFSSSLSSTEEIAQDNLKKLATANNELSLKLLRQLTSNSTGNVFFSPLSLSTVFGMLYYGTRGDAAKELRTVLGYDTADLQEEKVHETFHQYLTQYLPSQDHSTYVFTSANAVLVDKRLNLLPSYKKIVEDLYQAWVQDVDFETSTSKVVDDVNRWAQEKTNGTIENFLDDLDKSTSLLLLNSVYFKGSWAYKFLIQNASLETFYNNGRETGAKKVWMMNRYSPVPYTALYDFRALELPYSGKTVSMIILLPNERDGLESMEKNLTLEKLSEVRMKMYITSVHVFLPKFKIEYSKEMSEDFKSIGAKRVFTPGAHFIGFASAPNHSLCSVVHTAVLEVNERGSFAAAKSKLGIRRRSRYRNKATFLADHPFFFAIVDKRYDMILFSGHVTNF